MNTINLNVEGMSCGGCERSIRTALKQRSGVSHAIADHKAGQVTVIYDDTRVHAPSLVATIKDAGFDVGVF